MSQPYLLLALLLVAALPARADIYKYVDERGHVTYSNKPIKGGQKVELPEISTVPAPKLEPKPARALGVDEREQQKEALAKRIAAAEQALAEAKRAYQEGAEKPEVFVRRDGTRGRNVAAYEEKMKRLQEEVDRRQKELDDLKAQLADLEGRGQTLAPPASVPEARPR
ncbi:DUF4124 domain-containing protein [Thiobacter aerophilum]|uniref:DUF4124 domain-containing protein n=1 Tax=Thiobacter aerophilum TaxID=3121275 RepID=A0ABV0EEQ0_9BURK